MSILSRVFAKIMFKDEGDNKYKDVAESNPLPTRLPQVTDVATSSIRTLDYATAELHDGERYVERGNFPLAKAGISELLVVTPDSDVRIHFTATIEALTSQVLFEIFEDVSTTSDGTLLPSKNRNRNFPDGSKAKTYIAPTGVTGDTPANTLIPGILIGAGRNSSGGSARDSAEIVLRRNTKYLGRITEQNVQATDVNYSLDWYEHVDSS